MEKHNSSIINSNNIIFSAVFTSNNCKFAVITCFNFKVVIYFCIESNVVVIKNPGGANMADEKLKDSVAVTIPQQHKKFKKEEIQSLRKKLKIASCVCGAFGFAAIAFSIIGGKRGWLVQKEAANIGKAGLGALCISVVPEISEKLEAGASSKFADKFLSLLGLEA